MPSLLEVFKQKFSQDEIADLEDMSFTTLVLSLGVSDLSEDIGGKKVKLGHVDPNDSVHTATLEDSGKTIRFNNDEDVYQ